MERQRTPPLYDFRLSDLRKWHIVEGICWRCNRTAEIRHADLLRGRAPYARLRDLAAALRCQRCGRRGGHDISVKMKGRN
jgi:hypothetical protein